MKVAIGADHRGFAYKAWLLTHTSINGITIEWHDVGAYTDVRSDYPVFAIRVAELITARTVDRGILLCGSGIGMVIAANRYHGVYAGLVWNPLVAHFAMEHDKVNVISIPADFVSQDEVLAIVQHWLQATFQGARHQERIDLIDAIK